MIVSTVPLPAVALDRLAAADAHVPPWRSLDPARDRARPLLELGRALLGGQPDPVVAEAWAQGLAEIAAAIAHAFPRNIFGDLDFLAASLWRGAQAAPDPLPWLRARCRQVVALQALFGEGTAIRFRYVHDFVYGFDWAKWVARDPDARAGGKPFGPEFLAFMERRGHELLQLIARGDDRKYPPLPDGRPRNPFGFSREPAAEIALHCRLAEEGLVPVPAWRLDARPVWDRPFAELRRQRARALGLGAEEAAAGS